LEFYPGDEFADEANKRIAAVNSGKFNLPAASEAAASSASNAFSDVQSQDSQGSGFDSNLSQAAAPDNFDPFGSNAGAGGGGISDELSNFLSNDPFGGNSSGF
jgi:hypothetical protein